MAGSELISPVQLFHIHLQTSEHYLPLPDFIKLSQSTRVISENLSEVIFGNNAKIDFLIFPPETGSFHIKIGFKSLTVAGFLGGAWVFLNSDIGNAFIKGFTDHDAIYWSEWAGKKAKETLSEAHENFEEYKKGILYTKIISECTKGFISIDESKIKKIGANTPQFRNALSAKNIFYETCIDNNEITGLGFSPRNEFPIKRNSFPKKIGSIPDSSKNDDDLNWAWETRTILITSPVWVKDGRKWQAVYTINKKRKSTSITIEDELFWSYVENNKLETQILDRMKVQWAFITEGGRQKHTRVLKVLEFNGRKISPRLNENQIRQMLSKAYPSEREDPELFD
ncbi:MAG: hypothetical protein LDL37_03355 [Asticcacaulis sp.]|uniref:hypothetical protein n=1 Tax=Asticcacaulis sp. TaxID=1872648 RepID=UPI0025C4DE16|nr:hypothetical protein [Asticcacaulis sp.]MCA1934462.1 hypothetical protein [Asticcacaulis sp.]